MKKFFASALLAAAAVAPAFAQEAETVEDANRLLVNRTPVEYTAFDINRIDKVYFGRVDGPVYCSIQIENVLVDGLTVTLTKSVDCASYTVACIPASISLQLSDDIKLIDYITSGSVPSDTFTADYFSATLSGLNLVKGAKYALITIGLDNYGIPCEVRREMFYALSDPVEGNPKVDVEFTNISLTSITAKLVPNEDVSTYYYMLLPKGELEARFQKFAAMLGCSNEGQLIMEWNQPTTGTEEHTFSDLLPNSDYQLYVQPMDINNKQAPLQEIAVRTGSNGGSGDSSVEITQGDYKLVNWGSTDRPWYKPSMFFTFTPNENTSAYRYGFYEESEYDADPEKCNKSLCSEPPFPTDYWYTYEALTTSYMVDPGTKIVVIAAGKNDKDEWGEVNVLRVQVPSEEPTEKADAPARRATERRTLRRPHQDAPAVPGRIIIR